jgi:hypothetical protein
MSIIQDNINKEIIVNNDESDYRQYLDADNYLTYKEFSKGNLNRKRRNNIKEIMVRHELTADNVHRKRLAEQHHYALTRERLQKKLEEKRGEERRG